MSPAKSTLKDFNLRLTDCRAEMLVIFNEKGHALSHGDIEGMLTEKFDRVTLYRTLKTFLEKGLIHKVLDDEGGAKYALCRDACHTTDQQHHHDHVHFKCNVCGLTNCLDDVRVPTLELPQGYQRRETTLLVQGICPLCNIQDN
ncbi:MAG: transcriptional repressor [Cytophagaceae bacterium]|nr:transcriptional repressor [Cytophagaceae bacterium]